VWRFRAARGVAAVSRDAAGARRGASEGSSSSSEDSATTNDRDDARRCVATRVRDRAMTSDDPTAIPTTSATRGCDALAAATRRSRAMTNR